MSFVRGKAPVFVKMCMEDYYNCSTEELRKTLKKLCRFGEKQSFPKRTIKDRIKSLFFKRALDASRSVLYLSSADPYSGGIIACQMFELFIVFEWLLICNTEEKINEFFDFGWIESLPHLSQQPAKAGKYLYKIKQINPERFKLPNIVFKNDADYLNRKNYRKVWHGSTLEKMEKQLSEKQNDPSLSEAEREILSHIFMERKMYQLLCAYKHHSPYALQSYFPQSQRNDANIAMRIASLILYYFYSQCDLLKSLPPLLCGEMYQNVFCFKKTSKLNGY